MNPTAWRDSTARVLRDLWLAIFTQDTVLVRRCVRRVAGRLPIVREDLRDGVTVLFGACSLFALLVVIFVGIPMYAPALRAWLVGAP